MLEVKNLNVSYGVLPVLHDVDLTVQENEVVALLGSNGAGKSTLFNTIQGMMKPTSGSILFLGKPIEGLPPHKVIAEGIAQVPEGRRLFPFMTVRENLLLGGLPREGLAREREKNGMGHGAFPDSQREGPYAFPPPLRRGATDADHRPGSDGPASDAFGR